MTGAAFQISGNTLHHRSLDHLAIGLGISSGICTDKASELAFYRYALRHLRPAFPQLPTRSQFNRLQRQQRDAIVAFALYLAQGLLSPDDACEALDSAAVPTPDAKRRGNGWLAGQADIGWSNRLGWYEGFHLLVAATPGGVIRGFGFASASTKDQPLTEAFFALRHQPASRLGSCGQSACGVYVVDTGFEGRAWHQHWWVDYGSRVIGRPRRTSRHSWPKALRRWLAGLRQIVETVFDKKHVQPDVHLRRERDRFAR